MQRNVLKSSIEGKTKIRDFSRYADDAGSPADLLALFLSFASSKSIFSPHLQPVSRSGKCTSSSLTQ
jgi:hypothetical protein